jgi:hypothetical protein
MMTNHVAYCTTIDRLSIGGTDNDKGVRRGTLLPGSRCYLFQFSHWALTPPKIRHFSRNPNLLTLDICA